MNTWLTDILSWYIYMYVHLPCNGMLQGHDPLIIEEKKKKKRKNKKRSWQVRKLFHSPPDSQVTQTQRKRCRSEHKSSTEKKGIRRVREAKRRCPCRFWLFLYIPYTPDDDRHRCSDNMSPSQLILHCNFKRKKITHGSQVCASILRSSGTRGYWRHTWQILTAWRG